MSSAMESVHFSRVCKNGTYNWSDILYKFHRKNDERPFGTDVDVMCKGGYIPVHSWVLMAASDMLKEHLMSQSRSEREHMVVHLPDYDIADVTPVIFLFYTGMCLIPRKNMMIIFEIIESLGVSTSNHNIKFATPCNEDLQHKCSIRRYLDCDDDEEISFDEEDDQLNVESNLSSETVAVQKINGINKRKEIQRNSSPPTKSLSSQKNVSPSNPSSFCQAGPSSASKNSINVRTDSVPNNNNKNNVVQNGDCGGGGSTSSDSNQNKLTKKSIPEPKIARAVKVMRDGNSVKLIHAGDTNYTETSKERNKSTSKNNNNNENDDDDDDDNNNLDNGTTNNSTHIQNNDHFEDSNHPEEEEEEEEEKEDDVENERLINKNKKSKKRDSNEKNNKHKLVSDSEEEEEQDDEQEEEENVNITKKPSSTSTTNKRKITPHNNNKSKRQRKSESPAPSEKSHDDEEHSSSDFLAEDNEDESESELDLDEGLDDEDMDVDKSESDDDSESSVDKEKILRHGTRTRPVKGTKEIRQSHRRTKTRRSKDESASPQIKRRLRKRRPNSKNNHHEEEGEEEEEEDEDDEGSDYGSKTSNSKRVSTRRGIKRKTRKCRKPTDEKCPVCKTVQDKKFLRYHITNCGARLKMNIDSMKCKICNQKFPSLSLSDFVSHVLKCKPTNEDSDEEEEEDDDDDVKDKDGDGERENDKENEDNNSESSGESSDSSNKKDYKGRNGKRKNKLDSDDSCYDRDDHRSKNSTRTSQVKPSENIESGDIEGSEGDVEAEECLTFYEAYVHIERLPKLELEKYLDKYLKSLTVHPNERNRRLSSSEQGSTSSSSSSGNSSTKTLNLNRESQKSKNSDKNNEATARDEKGKKDKNTKDTEVVSPTTNINKNSDANIEKAKLLESNKKTKPTTKQTINRETILKRTKNLFDKMRTCPTCKIGFDNCKLSMHCLLTHKLRRCWVCLQTFNDSPTNDENHFQSKHSLGGDKKDQALCSICDSEIPWKNMQKHVTNEHFQILLNDSNETRRLSKEIPEKSLKQNSTIHNQAQNNNKNNSTNNNNKNKNSNENNDDDGEEEEEEEDEEENEALPRLKIKDPALLFESDDEDKNEESTRSSSSIPASTTTQQQPLQKGVPNVSNESNQRLPVYVAENQQQQQQQQSRQLNPTPNLNPQTSTVSTTNRNPTSIIPPTLSETNRQRIAATIPNRTPPPPLVFPLRGQTSVLQPVMSAPVSGVRRLSGTSTTFNSSTTGFQQQSSSSVHQNSIFIPQPQTSAPISYNNNNNNNSFNNNTATSSTHATRPNNNNINNSNNSAHFNNQSHSNPQHFQPRLSTPINLNSLNATNNNLMGQHQQQQPNPEAIADSIRNFLYNPSTSSPRNSPGDHPSLSSAPVCLSSNNASRTTLVPARGVNSVVLSSRNLPPVTNPQSAVALPTQHYQQQQQQQQHRNPLDYHHTHNVSQQPPPLIQQQQQQMYPHQQQQQQQQFYPSSNIQNNMGLMTTNNNNNVHLNSRNIPPPLSSSGNHAATYFGKTTIAGVPFKVFQRPENSIPHPGTVCSISTAPSPNGGFIATSIHSPQPDLNRPSITYPMPNTDSNINTTSNNNNQVNQNLTITYPNMSNNNQNESSGSTTNTENFSCSSCEQSFSCASSLDNHLCFSLD